jgi:hypothetical protein
MVPAADCDGDAAACTAKSEGGFTVTAVADAATISAAASGCGVNPFIASH